MAAPESLSGEGPEMLVLQDEAGQAFAFRPLRALRDGTDVFLLAERPETPGEAFAAYVKAGGRLEAVVDEAYLRRLRIHLDGVRP